MRRFFIVAVCMFFALPVSAAYWHVDPTTSKLVFEAEQAGEKFQGVLPQFTSSIKFDEAALESASIHIAVTMAAAQVDGKDRMDALPTDDWFAVKQFPFAEFLSTDVRLVGNDKTGVNSYVAKGKLTMRGISKEVELPFTLKITGKSAVARGTITLNRNDFGVGQGRWAGDEWVKHPVRVSFELHASAE